MVRKKTCTSDYTFHLQRLLHEKAISGKLKVHHLTKNCTTNQGETGGTRMLRSNYGQQLGLPIPSREGQINCGNKIRNQKSNKYGSREESEYVAGLGGLHTPQERGEDVPKQRMKFYWCHIKTGRHGA